MCIRDSCMTPLQIKQQKFSKLSAIMQPEIQKIQKKYQGKKDQDSMMKMQEETQAVYQKYGVSATGSCVQLAIQMPILFALYQVIQNIPAYVGSVYEDTEININCSYGGGHLYSRPVVHCHTDVYKRQVLPLSALSDRYVRLP